MSSSPSEPILNPAPAPANPAPDSKPAPPAKPWIATKCDGHLAKAAEIRKEMIDKSGGYMSPAGPLMQWNDLSIELDNAASIASLYAEVHPEEATRTAAEECVQRVDKLATEIKLDRQIYDALAGLDAKTLDADAQRVLMLTLREFRRAGVDKDDATRARLKEISERMVVVGQTFDKNIRDDVRTVELDPKQLEGLPQDWIDAHKPNAAGKVVVNTDYPDYIPFRTYAKDPTARAALFKVYMNRGWPQNDAVYKEILALRKEQATLLGYASWADYDAEVKMIKNGKSIADFIDKIAKAADKAAHKDYAELLKRKKKDDPKATSVEGSDSLYYETLVKKEKYDFDPQTVRPYFDFQRTLEGLLTVNSKLWGISFEKATDAKPWHPDVQVFDVMKDGQKIGRIYLDLHPREGKYKHAAQFNVVSGIDGRQLPEGALVCNFSAGLMEHDDVETMFHEFGHLMHHILGGHTHWARFSGVATEWDFVEAPSQLMEEWALDPGVLALFAKDDKGNVIPKELVQKLRAAKEFGKGNWVRTQMFYAALSLNVHLADPKTIDLTKMVMDLQKKYAMVPYTPDTHMQAAFGHLNGYSSGYYTYMWSLVIAKDMFSAFEKKGLLDETVSHKYRDTVLAMGGRKDAADLVKDFLGRPYGFDSFKKWLDR